MRLYWSLGCTIRKAVQRRKVSQPVPRRQELCHIVSHASTQTLTGSEMLFPNQIEDCYREVLRWLWMASSEDIRANSKSPGDISEHLE
jgi:uncharacterized Fe-S radical SAM superfamily protein PflX